MLFGIASVRVGSVVSVSDGKGILVSGSVCGGSVCGGSVEAGSVTAADSGTAPRRIVDSGEDITTTGGSVLGASAASAQQPERQNRSGSKRYSRFISV